ncbi:MAG: PD-(D/E)XK nuclease family protein [Candidatus Scalinduaceae bacterium]
MIKKDNLKKLKEWSYSRRVTLEQCPRKYYYTYYGANKKTAKNETQKEKIRFLKNIKNRYLRSGEILHLIIATYIKKLRNGIEWSEQRCLSWARSIFEKDLDFSRNYRHNDALPNDNYPPKLLLEFYYGYKDAESTCTNRFQEVEAALANFFSTQDYAELRNSAFGENVLIEELIRVKEDDLTIRGQIDFAYSNVNGAKVIDWKMGKAGGGDDSLQLISYAIAACQEFNCFPDDIELHLVHLLEGSISSYNIDKSQVFRAKARIRQDIERMQSLENYGRNAIVEAFTPCLQSEICKGCVYQAVCL